MSEEGVHLSLAEHYLVDEVHFIRSLEFNVSADAKDFETAVNHFEENADHYFRFLVERASEVGLAENERRELSILRKRFFDIYEKREQYLQELDTALRKQAHDSAEGKRPGPTWLPQTTPTTSAPQSND